MANLEIYLPYLVKYIVCKLLYILIKLRNMPPKLFSLKITKPLREQLWKNPSLNVHKVINSTNPFLAIVKVHVNGNPTSLEELLQDTILFDILLLLLSV